MVAKQFIVIINGMVMPAYFCFFACLLMFILVWCQIGKTFDVQATKGYLLLTANSLHY